MPAHAEFAPALRNAVLPVLTHRQEHDVDNAIYEEERVERGLQEGNLERRHESREEERADDDRVPVAHKTAVSAQRAS